VYVKSSTWYVKTTWYVKSLVLEAHCMNAHFSRYKLDGVSVRSKIDELTLFGDA